VETEIAWADLKGYVGLRFHNVPASSQELLEGWLNNQMEQQIPGSKDSCWANSPRHPIIPRLDLQVFDLRVFSW